MWDVGDIKPAKSSKSKASKQQQQQQSKPTKARDGPSKWSSNVSIASSTASNKKGASSSAPTKPKPVKQHIKDLKTGSVLVPGRHPCLCEALKHSLVSNCLNCGRIVCEQEGPGECFTCGQLVIPKEDRKILREGDFKKVREILFFWNQNRAEPLYMGPSAAADTPSRLERKKEKLKQAIDKRDQLIYFDLTSSLRNKVIDEHSDYYNIEFRKWLRPEDRESLKKEISQLHAKKFEKKQYLDISMAADWGAKEAVKVVERATLPDFNEKVDLLEIAALESVKSNFVPLTWQDVERRHEESEAVKLELQAKCSEERRRRWEQRKKRGQVPSYEEYDSDRERQREQNELRERREKRDKKEYGGRIRVQGASWNHASNEDEESENIDALPLLKVRQPWASLIMSGIKLVEGRNYPAKRIDTRIRIAAPRYVPSDEEIERAVNFYQQYLGVPLERFPKEYPTDCILGTVKLVDCMSQEEWRKWVAAEEEQKWFEEINGPSHDKSEQEVEEDGAQMNSLTIPDYVRDRIEKRCYIDDPYVWILEDPVMLDDFGMVPQHQDSNEMNDLSK